ncbi:MAG: MBL fold metallo-hydrolase [Candidatus Woesearchaeota archaeon]
MKFVFHGGAKEVGKSCIELVTQGNRFILDAGLKFKEHGFEAPFNVFHIEQIDGLLLSHAHLDHTGSLPLFEHYNLLCPIYCTAQTKELTKILLKDSYKIARIRHLHPAYQTMDLKKVDQSTHIVQFDKEYQAKNISFAFLNAGHIPGSSMILIKTEGKKILYSGDFKMDTTALMKGARDSFKKNYDSGALQNIDILICESTYGDKPLPNRKEIEENFLRRIDEVIIKGSVIIPVFSLGRAQEILLLLAQKKWAVPVYFDGMCVDVTDLIMKNDPSYIVNKQKLSNALKHVIAIKKESQREKIIHQRAIFISTSGMVQGGPVMHYIENMWGNSDNAIFLTGYQCKRTNGRTLLDDRSLYLSGWKTYVKCQVEKFDFSGHADANELKEFVGLIKPQHVIFQHGDPEAVDILVAWAKSFRYDAYGPNVDDTIEF